jgi:ethanolamine utilization cobalamin adenosyltransferase
MKPEQLTHLSGAELVSKTHPRIRFRGKLDTLEAETVLFMARNSGSERLCNDLKDIISLLRRVMRAEVTDEPLGEFSLLGLDPSQLRDYSHHPEKYYGVKAMTVPDSSLGCLYVELNLLRAKTRETEIAAVEAFSGGGVEREDILTALNRLSSAVYIMMCRCQNGRYGD